MILFAVFLLMLCTRTTCLVPKYSNGALYDCKCYYGDSCWPTPEQWSSLNGSVGGNLLIGTPPGAACYNTFQGPLGDVQAYDSEKCAHITTSFTDEQWTTDQPEAVMWTFFTNDTCRPTKNPRDTCTLGFYGVYVMVAKEPGHVKAGIDFARTHNLRLTIRNTGHDWFGRSTGWGALVINTHTFQNISIIDDYSGPGNYTGAAVTIGAGVQGRELLRQINKHQPPLSVAVGECPVCQHDFCLFRRKHSKRTDLCFRSDRGSLWRLRAGRRAWTFDNTVRTRCR